MIITELKQLGTPRSTVFEVTKNTKVDPKSGQIDVVVDCEFEDAQALAVHKAIQSILQSPGVKRKH